MRFRPFVSRASFSRFGLAVGFGAAIGVASGFAQQARSVAAAPANVVQGVSGDVQILQAWKGAVIGDSSLDLSGVAGIKLDLKACTSLGVDVFGIRRVDCSRQIQAQTKVGDSKQLSPLLNRAVFNVLAPSGGKVLAASGRCRLIEIRALLKKTAYENPVFQGVGFLLADGTVQDGIDSFVAKKDLHLVGKTTLENGEEAVVARMTAFGFCASLGGGAESVEAQRLQFKPYARYDVLAPTGQVVVYKNWESIDPPHLIRGTGPGFDRQLKLLKR